MVFLCALFLHALVSYIAMCSYMVISLPLGTTEKNTEDMVKVLSNDGQTKSMLEQATVKTSQSVNVYKFQNTGQCVPPVTEGSFHDMGCSSKVHYDFQENRIPQLLPNVQCAISFPSLKYRPRRTKSVCEEVRYNMQVLYDNSTTDETPQYSSSMYSISVACIRSAVPTFPVESRPQNVLIAEKLE